MLCEIGRHLLSKETDMVQNSAPSNTEILQYGGQAVIEGVMMRSPRYFAVACRKPDGEIVIQCEEVDKSIMGRLKWLNKPFLRGTLALIDAMALGTRALAFASNVQMEAEQQSKLEEGKLSLSEYDHYPAAEQAKEEVLGTAASIVNGLPTTVPVTSTRQSKINDIAIGGTIAFSFVFGIALFVLLPTAITGLLQHFGYTGALDRNHDLKLNIFDGLIRMGIFFGYIGAISMMSQVKQVFMYHGAEHKAINTLEAGLPLTSDQALKASRIHPRCGTSFIFIVLVINLIVFAMLPRPAFVIMRFLLHLAVIPFVAGVAYEIIKFAGKHRRNPIISAVLAPGMWSQYLTTREPNAQQVEVSLAALNAVLVAEGHIPVVSTPAEIIRERAEAEPLIA